MNWFKVDGYCNIIREVSDKNKRFSEKHYFTRKDSFFETRQEAVTFLLQRMQEDVKQRVKELKEAERKLAAFIKKHEIEI